MRKEIVVLVRGLLVESVRPAGAQFRQSNIARHLHRHHADGRGIGGQPLIVHLAIAIERQAGDDMNRRRDGVVGQSAFQ